MDWLQIVILGIVQGITEFLPVSSSGHLVIVQSLFQELNRQELPSEVVEVNIFLHLGTLLAIIVFYRQQIIDLLRKDRRVIGMLIVGTVPAAAIGLPLRHFDSTNQLLESALLTGFLLIATGLMLIWCGRRTEGDNSYHGMTFGQAMLIGMFQALAILPGLSRSGWTIGGGLLVGLRRDSAATFSFLLAIPAIAGASLLETAKLVSVGSTGTRPDILALGVVVSFLVGYVSLWGLVHTIRRGKLQWFAVWCIPIGLAVIVWQLAA